jgi:peptidyl-prolyl cis-trans isomerase A (cyclophilin A)
MQRYPQFPEGALMRKTFAIFIFSLAAACATSAQSSTGSQAAPAKSASAAKPATPAAPAKPTAIIDTTVGKMTCTLFPDKAPIGVANFIGLSTGTKDWKNPVGTMKHGVPLYDGTIFHRVIPEFMIQGGDPAGTGSGPDPVAAFKNEASPDLLFDQPGRLAYANAGPNTNSSQFFITEVATPHLNGNYTIFGQCDEASVALVKQITHMATDPRNDRPFRPVKIIHITILHGGAAAKPAGTAVKKPATAATKPAAN